MNNLSANLTGKYLTFSLAKEEFGIDILKVREIIGMMNITAIPQAAAFVKGVINLRGRVIPIIDLRNKFGMDGAEYTPRTCIIVVEIQSQTKDFITGLIVDSVSEVTNIRADNIEATPHLGSSVSLDFIKGMAKTDSDVKILLDIDKILSGNEIKMMRNAASA